MSAQHFGDESATVKQAVERAREFERLIVFVEAEARKSEYWRTTWANVRELKHFAGALRFTLRYLLEAIKKARLGSIVCAACHRETIELETSRTLAGARCVSCAVPALDAQIAALTAEVERLRRERAPIDEPAGALTQPPKLLSAEGKACRKPRKPSARRKPNPSPGQSI